MPMFRRIIFAALVLVGFIWAWHTGFLLSPDDGAGVVLGMELRPARQVIKAGKMPVFTATLDNQSERTITLVEPGDGSEAGMRTPLLRWAPPQTQPGRCG